jgi:hypothetical protein
MPKSLNWAPIYTDNVQKRAILIVNYEGRHQWLVHQKDRIDKANVNKLELSNHP